MQAKVVFAQINPMVGDIAGNAAKILTEAREAAASLASVSIFAAFPAISPTIGLIWAKTTFACISIDPF